MLRRWKWIRPTQGCPELLLLCLAGWLHDVLDLVAVGVHRELGEEGVSAISFSQSWDPMKPCAPIMKITMGWMGFRSRSILLPHHRDSPSGDCHLTPSSLASRKTEKERNPERSAASKIKVGARLPPLADFLSSGKEREAGRDIERAPARSARVYLNATAGGSPRLLSRRMNDR